MPRPCKRRIVEFTPNISYFKPVGVPMRDLDSISLTSEEVEAIRLNDYLGLTQSEASKKMGISQPTFNRIISSARKKISDALINGKAIEIIINENKE